MKIDFEKFSLELDAAMQAHLEWSRRVLNCAVCHTSPGSDALALNAHTLCRFGRWLSDNAKSITALDPKRAKSLIAEHKLMHDSVRAICSRILKGKPGKESDLVTFEKTQTQLIDLLAYFKTLAVTRCSQIDALTGLPLRHSMDHDFNLLRECSQRNNKTLCVMMIDLDYFKLINDKYGHDAGDAVLQTLAESLKQTLRASDVAYRFGGEEFLLLTQLATTDIKVVAQRVLVAIRALVITLPNNETIQVTATIGIARAIDNDNLASVIKRADAALYKGKESGRDCYVLSEEPASSYPLNSEGVQNSVSG